MRLQASLLIALTPACSLLYDPGDLPAVDGAAPPGPRVAGPPVVEGRGCARAGCDRADPRRRPSTLLVTGDNLDRVVDVRLEVRGRGGEAIEIPAEVLATSADRHRIAVAVWSPPDARLDGAQLATLAYSLGESPVRIEGVPFTGLPELTVDATSIGFALAARYSTIELAAGAGVDWPTGLAPVVLHASGDIELAAPLRVNARARQPGPGSCAGGTMIVDAGCVSGGRRGVDGRGGGGGFGTAGDDGDDAEGGPVTGTALLVPLGIAQGFDNAGSGGGAGNGDGSGDGGGGGGAIELVTEGRLVIGGGGRLTADGGDGAGAASVSGGGGSGGAIVLRPLAGVSAPEVAWISARGGASAGGVHGGQGRIRADSLDGVAAMVVADSGIFASGPTWQDVGLVVPERELLIRIAHTPTPFVEVSGGARGEPLPDGQVRVVLGPGSNEVCLVADPTAPLTLSANRTCVDVIALGL